MDGLSLIVGAAFGAMLLFLYYVGKVRHQRQKSTAVTFKDGKVLQLTQTIQRGDPGLMLRYRVLASDGGVEIAAGGRLIPSQKDVKAVMTDMCREWKEVAEIDVDPGLFKTKEEKWGG